MHNAEDIKNQISSGADSGAASAGVPDAQQWHDALRTLGTPDHTANATEPVYEGHVTLELNADILSGIEATLDTLASAHDLFDAGTHDIGGHHTDTHGG